MVLINRAWYYYRQRKGSIVNSKLTQKHYIDAIEAYRSNIVFLAERNEEDVLRVAINAFCKQSILRYKKALMDGMPQSCEYINREYVATWKKYRRKFGKIGLKKIVYDLFMFVPNYIIKLY